MFKRNELLVITILLGTLAMVGCSNDDAVSPMASEPEARVDGNAEMIPGVDRFDGMSDLEMLASLKDMVNPTESKIIRRNGSFEDVKKLFRQQGIPGMTEDKRPTPLPAPLTLVGMAARAMAVADDGTYWDQFTQFITASNDEDFWGFQIGWLEDIPEEPDPDAYHFYYFMERNDVDPVNPVEVEPSSGPIYDATLRVYKALQNPETTYNRYYLSDGPILFQYIFYFETPDGDRRFEMFKIRLHL